MAKQPRPSSPSARPWQLVLERQPDESLAQWEQALAVIVRGGVGCAALPFAHFGR